MLQRLTSYQRLFLRYPQYSFFTKKGQQESEPVKEQVQQQEQEQQLDENLAQDIALNYNEHPLENILKNFQSQKDNIINSYSPFSFETDIQPTLNHLKDYGFNKTFFTGLYKSQPFSFIKLTSENQNIINNSIKSDAFQLTEFLENFGVRKDLIKHVLLKVPGLFELTIPQIQDRINYLVSTFNLNDKQMIHIVQYYPQLLDHDQFINIPEKLHIFNSWLQLTPEQLTETVVKFPWILKIEPQTLKDNLKLLSSRGFSQENIHQMINKDPEFLSMNTINLEKAFYLPVKILGVKNSIYVKHMVNDPRLITTCPTSIIPIKYKVLLEDYLVKYKTVKKIYIEQPEVFVKSIASLKIKLKYLQVRHKFNFEEESEIFPKILSYNYQDIIRPRGEAMIKTQNIYPYNEILDLSDEQFCEKIEIDQQEFQNIKDIIQSSEELDYQKKSFHKNFGNYTNYIETYDQLDLQ